MIEGLRDWNEYVRLLVGLLALINPLTVLPIFLGGALLDLFAITINSFRIAGGILLLLTALEMMRTKAMTGDGAGATQPSLTSVGIVPLGIPLLAGPGAPSSPPASMPPRGTPSRTRLR